MDTHLGLAVAGFPNMLFLYGPQSPTAFCNGPTCAEVQGDWVVALLSHLRDQRHTRIEATTDAASSWTAQLNEIGAATLLVKADSWYIGANIPGKRRQLLNYPDSDSYIAQLDATAANGYTGFLLA